MTGTVGCVCNPKHAALEKANVPFEQRAQVSLTALHDVSVPVQRNPATDQFDPLARYRLTWNAPDNEWVEIEKGLFFQQRTHRDSSPEDDGDSFGGSPPARTVRESFVGDGL